ncbi:MAG: ankyrin repeat domain-containing protein [Parachlamydia sp.]|nr:ankyrin repeat domain-containing protein [Parachlamydia sp.]
MELWAWAEKLHIELLNAQEKLAAIAQKRQMEKEQQDFRQKMELLKLQAQHAHQDWEYLLKMQQLKAEGKFNLESNAGTLPGIPKTNTLLHQAAKAGDTWMVQKFLEAKFSKDNLDDEGNTPLACAVVAGKLGVAKLFTPNKKNTSFANKQGQSLLHLATLSGNLDMVIWIHSLNKERVDYRDSANQTPLFCAVAGNYLEIAKYLKEQKAKLSVFDNQGKTLLDCSFEHDETDMTEWLVDQDPELLRKKGRNGCQPVTEAIRKGNHLLAEKMLKNGAVFDIKNSANKTLLHAVAKKGFRECIEWLVKKGLPIDEVDAEGHTPIICAALDGQTEAVECLKKLNAKTAFPLPIEIIVNDNLIVSAPTLAHVAVLGAHPIEVLDEVVHKKEDLLTPSKEGWIPLQLAVLKGLLPVVDYLLGHEFHENPSTQKRDTLLLLAVDSGSLKMVQRIFPQVPQGPEHILSALREAVSLDALAIAQWLYQQTRTPPNSTALFSWAVKGQKLEVLKWILSFDHVDVNYFDPDQKEAQTPFQTACYHQNWEAANHLLTHQASPKVKYSNGNTPWHLILGRQKPPALKWIKALTNWLDASAINTSRMTQFAIHWLGYFSVNTKNKDGMAPIQIAIRRGWKLIAEGLEKEAKADTQVLDNENRTLLHLAAESRSRECVIYACSKCKLYLNAKTNNGRTALEISIEVEDYASANYLFMDKDAALSKDSQVRKKYLFHAVAGGLAKVVEKILSQDEYQRREYYDDQGRSIRLVAALQGQFALADKELSSKSICCQGEQLLVYHVINDAKDPVKVLQWLYSKLKISIILESHSPHKNALEHAVVKKQLATAQFLSTKRVTIDRAGGLFDIAVQSGSLEMVEWTYNISDKGSLTSARCIKTNQVQLARWCHQSSIPLPPFPLHLWAQFNGSLELLNFLLAQGCQWEERNQEGKTALYVALWHQNPVAAQFLLDQKISLNLTTEEKREVLEAVLFNPLFSTEFFEWLLLLGEWPLQSTDKNGLTLLEEAIFVGAARAAHVLIQKGGTTNLTLYNRETVSRFQEEAKSKYPVVVLPNNSKHSDDLSEKDLEVYLNCARSVDTLVKNSRDRTLSAFSRNNPIHSTLHYIAIIHGLFWNRYPFQLNGVMSPFHDPQKSVVSSLVYSLIYGERPYFTIFSENLTGLKVPLPGNFTFEGSCIFHLAVIAENRSIKNKEESWLKEIQKNRFVDASAAIYKDGILVEELTVLGFAVLNPLKLQHALPIAKQLLDMGADRNAVTKSGKGLKELARLSQDRQTIEWVDSLFTEKQNTSAFLNIFKSK